MVNPLFYQISGALSLECMFMKDGLKKMRYIGNTLRIKHSGKM